MRNIISLIALLVIGLSTNASAQTCDFSGAPTGPSHARTTLRVQDSDGWHTHHFGGPAHAFYYVSDIYGNDPKLGSVTVADYVAAQDGRTRMIDAATAYYLWDTDVAPYGTEADPSVVAFSSRDAAQEWQRELGGEVVQGWDDVWSRLDSAYSTSYGEMGDRRKRIEYESN